MTVLDRPAVSAPGPSAPRRGTGLLLRWWRRLTAMRTAIVLLFLLALGAVPGQAPGAVVLQKVSMALNWTMRPSSISEGWSHSGP